MVGSLAWHANGTQPGGRLRRLRNRRRGSAWFRPWGSALQRDELMLWVVHGATASAIRPQFSREWRFGARSRVNHTWSRGRL